MKLSDAIADGQSWVSAHGGDLGARAGEVARLGTLRRKAMALEAAREGRPSVAVFGQSQSGKSYLVSSLAFAKGNTSVKLNVKADRIIDFETDINPVGNQRESTALVTRFTPFTPVQEDLPFKLRLLSQVDVVCLLANAFVHDLKWQDYDAALADRMAEVFDRLEKAAGAQAVDGCSEDDVGAIEDYVRERLPRHPGRELFERTQFWVRAAKLVPRLQASQRWEVLQFLWDCLDALNDTCSRLLAALKALSFSAEVQCGLDSLMPKHKEAAGRLVAHSIIDVGMLAAFFSKSNSDSVMVGVPGAMTVSIPRATMAALGLEITMPLPKQAVVDCPIYEEADVLDFPGYRSRDEIDRAKLKGDDKGDVLYEVLLRGKVAYLFERYCDHYGINGLAFCSPDTQPNVVGLPLALHRWVCETHGDTPKGRLGRPTSLFVVFTKFDLLYCAEAPGGQAGAGAGSDFYRSLVETRVLENFVRKYSTPVSDKWIDDWDGSGRAFDNCFWVRKPDIQKLAFQDASRRDGVVRDVCISSPAVKRHFKDPRRSYEAVVGVDGGVDLLVQQLAGVCGADARRRQLDDAAAILARDSVRLLARHFRGGNLDRDLAAAAAKGRAVATAIVALHQRNNRFGVMASLLTVNHDLAWQTEFDLPAWQGGENDTADGLASDLVPLGVDVLSELGLDLPHEKPRAAPPGGLEARPRQYAAALVDSWTRRLYAALADGGALLSLGLERSTASLLVEGLVGAAERVDLVGQIAHVVRPAMLRNVANRGRDEVASLAANTFNNFIDSLGYVFVPKGQRPSLKSGPVFDTLEAPRAFPQTIDFEATTLPGQKYLADWLKGLLHLYEANVSHSYGAGTIDTKANQQLGDILRGHGPAFDELVAG